MRVNAWEQRRHSLFGQGVTGSSVHMGVVPNLEKLKSSVQKMCAVRPNDEGLQRAAAVIAECQTSIRQIVQSSGAAPRKVEPSTSPGPGPRTAEPGVTDDTPTITRPS
jgi:hypothetical protein